MDNICLGIDKNKVDKSFYSRVIKQSQLSKLNDSFKGKIITSDGSTISGGQAQRIAIARLILQKVKYYFLG